MSTSSNILGPYYSPQPIVPNQPTQLQYVYPNYYYTYPNTFTYPATNTPYPDFNVTIQQPPGIYIVKLCFKCGKELGEDFFVRRYLGFCSRSCLKKYKIDEVVQKLDR